MKLRNAAIPHHISVCPVPIFSVKGEFRHFIRLNCAQALDSGVLDAIDVLGELAHQLNSPSKNRPA